MTLKTVMRTKIDLKGDTPVNEHHDQYSIKKKSGSSEKGISIQPFSLMPSMSEQNFKSHQSVKPSMSKVLSSFQGLKQNNGRRDIAKKLQSYENTRHLQQIVASTSDHIPDSRSVSRDPSIHPLTFDFFPPMRLDVKNEMNEENGLVFSKSEQKRNYMIGKQESMKDKLSSKAMNTHQQLPSYNIEQLNHFNLTTKKEAYSRASKTSSKHSPGPAMRLYTAQAGRLKSGTKKTFTQVNQSPQRYDTFDLAKHNNAWHSIDGTPEGSSCENKAVRKNQDRFYMYSQEYSPLVQFMQVIGPQHKKPRAHKSPMKVAESNDWNVLDQQIDEEGVVFKSNPSNPSKIESIDYRTSDDNRKEFQSGVYPLSS